MFLLIGGLQFQTFRPELAPYEETALLAGGIGLAILAIGIFLKPSKIRMTRTVSASRIFLYSSLFNSIAAVVFITPVLVPALKFPILITQWPGIYMVIAYSMFLLIGIIGMLGWSLVYYLAPTILSRILVDTRMMVLHFVLTELGIYALSISMFIGGYAGATILYEGAGPAVVGAQMEIGVIPSAVSIFTLMLGTVVGLATLFFAKRVDSREIFESGLRSEAGNRS